VERPEIKNVWLHRSGTILAVDWRESSPPERRRAIVREAFDSRAARSSRTGLESVADYGVRLLFCQREGPMQKTTETLTNRLQVRTDVPAAEGLQARSAQAGRGALLAGGLAAILASSCCLGPLVLVALGFSGAWIGNLTVLEPYRPIFIGGALVALFFAGRRIYRPATACKPGEVCAVQQVRTTYKAIFWIVAALVLMALAFPYVLPFFY
jgi:mercuric ion transport protein